MLLPLPLVCLWLRLRFARCARRATRTLPGLRLLRKDGERCGLFENPAFFRTSHWAISTSNLTSGESVGPCRVVGAPTTQPLGWLGQRVHLRCTTWRSGAA